MSVRCPVCGHLPEVNHHDHFRDFCNECLKATFPDRKFFHEYWDTFPVSRICRSCNAQDKVFRSKASGLRKKDGTNLRVPPWISFSVDELKKLKDTESDNFYSIFRPIWTNKMERFREKGIRHLLELGVSRETINELWMRQIPRKESHTQEYKKNLQKLLPYTSNEFKELYDEPGNDAALAGLISRFDPPWPYSAINRFVYDYHAKHGDPGCNNNHFEVGHEVFVAWFHLSSIGETEAAERYLAWAMEDDT